MVNPNLLMKGNDNKRQILLSYYATEDPIEQISFSRTKQKALKTEESTTVATLTAAVDTELIESGATDNEDN